eukprot:15438766-Alexandrium_andersonii.AAC.1
MGGKSPTQGGDPDKGEASPLSCLHPGEAAADEEDRRGESGRAPPPRGRRCCCPSLWPCRAVRPLFDVAPCDCSWAPDGPHPIRFEQSPTRT